MSTSINLLKPHRTRQTSGGLHRLLDSRRVMLACLLCSLALHLVVLLRFTGPAQQSAPVASVNHRLQLELHRYSRPQPLQDSRADAQPAQQHIEPVEKPVAVSPRLISSSSPLAPTTAKAVAQPTAEATLKAPSVQQVSADPPVSKPVPQAGAQSALLASAKQHYLQRIAAHLDQHKFYPRAARLRHIEGAVQVSFDLLENGNIANLQILSGHSTLQKATEESIYHALPLPARPRQLLALHNIKIEYAMRFSLRD